MLHISFFLRFLINLALHQQFCPWRMGEVQFYGFLGIIQGVLRFTGMKTFSLFWFWIPPCFFVFWSFCWFLYRFSTWQAFGSWKTGLGDGWLWWPCLALLWEEGYSHGDNGGSSGSDMKQKSCQIPCRKTWYWILCWYSWPRFFLLRRGLYPTWLRCCSFSRSRGDWLYLWYCNNTSWCKQRKCINNSRKRRKRMGFMAIARHPRKAKVPRTRMKWSMSSLKNRVTAL